MHIYSNGSFYDPYFEFWGSQLKRLHEPEHLGPQGLEHKMASTATKVSASAPHFELIFDFFIQKGQSVPVVASLACNLCECFELNRF